MVKADGCVAIHADGGAYKPLNWMNAPNTITEGERTWTVSNPAGETLTITVHEVHSDTRHDMGQDPGLVKDGVEAHLQELLAADPTSLGAELELVRREYPTDIGPVDLLCRDATGTAVAVEVKRRGRSTGWSSSRAISTASSAILRCVASGALRRSGGEAPGQGARREPRDPLGGGRLRRPAWDRGSTDAPLLRPAAPAVTLGPNPRDL
ncbi:MAG: endonuclease NucS [Microthrixaceae bacterium]|nr:endonuclease NucS [Microthrixaceae bacterium]